MFRIPTDHVRQAVIARTIGSRETISLGDVLSSSIPSGISSYLHAEVSGAFGASLEKFPLSDRLGEEGDDSRALRHAFVRAVVQDYRFGRNEFIGLLDRTLEFLSAYLPSPLGTLTDFVFESSVELTSPAIEEKLSRVADYRYLRILMTKAAARRPEGSMTRSLFSAQLFAFDQAVLAGHTPLQLVRIADPIFRFSLFGAPDESGRIPREALRTFYHEKKLTDFWESVEAKIDRDAPGITRGDLLSAIRSKSEPAEPAVHRGATGMEAGSEGGSGSTIPAPPPGEVTAESRGGELPDLAAVISGDQQAMFVNRIFRRDHAYYQAVLQSLNKTDTWKSAAMFLADFYETNNLNPFAKEVVEFTDAVYRRYDQAGSR
jgi:hypothetical protein